MPTPAEADAIARLSAFALFVLLTMFAGVALWRRWIVLGWFYDQERAQRVTAETQASRNAEALEANNVAMAQQSKVIGDQANELAGVRRELRELRTELRRAAGA
jgi:hypothetical protein